MSLKFGFVAQDIIDTGKISWDEINVIKKWLETRSDLPKYTDEQIICFHLACDKDDEATKATLESYNAIRNECPQIFSERHLDDQNLKKLQSVVNYCLLPKRTEDGCAIIFNKLINTSYTVYDFAAYIKMAFMVLDAAIYDSPPNGFILLVDMEGMGLMHITRLKVNIIKSAADYLQSALPVKLRNIHLINTNYVVDKILAVVMPFLSEHVASLLIRHPKKSLDNFRNKFIAKEYLPLELGGELPSIEIINQETIQKLKNIRSHFDDEEKQRQEFRL